LSQYGSPTTGETKIKPSRDAGVPGITESLATPGLANMPVTPSSGLNAFHELSTALGLAGNDIEQYGQQQLQERARQDRFREHAEQIDHAKALEHAETILPGLASQVADGKVSVWNDKGGESQTSQQAELWAESIAGSGNDAYSSKLRSALAPHLAHVLEQERERKIKTAAVETAKDYRSLLYTTVPGADGSEATNAGTDYVKPTPNADDPPVSQWRGGTVPGNIDDILQGGLSKVGNRLDRDQFAALSIMPAIRMAGKNGDTEAIDKLSKYVPDAFADSVENARLTAARVQASRNSKQTAAINNWIDEPVVAALNGDGDFQTAIDRNNRAYSDGLITSEDWERRHKSIKAAAHEATSQNKALMENIYEAQQKDIAVKIAREHIGQGGSAASIPTYKYLNPNTGEEKEIGPKVSGPLAVQADFDLIDQNAQNKAKAIQEMDATPEYKAQKLDETEQQRMAKKVRRLQRGDTYEPWAKIFSAMPANANPEMLAQPGPLPADVQNAVALRDRIPDDLFYRMASPESRHFWHTLDTTRELVTGNQPENIRQALVETNRHMTGDPLIAETKYNNIHIPNEAINDTAKGIFGSDVINPLLHREVETMAKYYMSMGADQDKALSMAADIVKKNTTIMGKYAVPTLGVHVPEHLSMASPLLLEEFVARNPKLGLKAEDLSLRPYGNGSWMVVRGEKADSPVMIPVETFPEDGLFTAKQIDDMLPGLVVRSKARLKEQRKQAAVDYVKRRGENRGSIYGHDNNAPFPGKPGFVPVPVDEPQ
jgi:hypothetical protein